MEDRTRPKNWLNIPPPLPQGEIVSEFGLVSEINERFDETQL